MTKRTNTATNELTAKLSASLDRRAARTPEPQEAAPARAVAPAAEKPAVFARERLSVQVPRGDRQAINAMLSQLLNSGRRGSDSVIVRIGLRLAAELATRDPERLIENFDILIAEDGRRK